MSATLKQKEIRELIGHIGRHPAVKRVDPTTDGWRILFRNGQTTSIHKTASDHRSTLNLRSTLRRNGVEWPWDDEQKKGKIQMENEGLLASKRPTQKVLDDVSRVMDELVAEGGIMFSITDVLTRRGSGSPPAIAAALYHLGWRKEDGRLGKWYLPERVLTIVPPSESDVEASENQPEPHRPEIERAKIARREFLDTVDSWTVDLRKSVDSMTIRDLRFLYAAAGINMEIRVWRDPSLLVPVRSEGELRVPVES